MALPFLGGSIPLSWMNMVILVYHGLSSCFQFLVRQFWDMYYQYQYTPCLESKSIPSISSLNWHF